MLIEFQVENFRSFRERQTFSMVAGPFSEHEKTNTFDSGLKGFERLLRTSVTYGPNAAGKTNLLRAIQFVQSLVINSATATNSQYNYTPFKLSSRTRKASSEFQITFAQDGVRYEYGFTMGPKRIETEWLNEYVHSKMRTRGRKMFSRSWSKKDDKYHWTFGSFLKGQRSLWGDSTRPDALFLSTAIQLNSVQLRPVFEWFQKRLVVIVGGTEMNRALTLKILNEPGGKEKLLPFLREADLGISDLIVQRERLPSPGVLVASGPGAIIEQHGKDTTLVKVTLSHLTDDPSSPIGLDFGDESSGTQILFNTAGAWLNVMANGEVLLFDEIDTNLHPSLLRFLVQKFHSKQANPNNAQLICSTHNTSLLDQELYRRDQVWFIEKDATGASRLYPLTDFKPRNDEVLERWYMRGRYGAQPSLPDIPQ